MNNQVLFSPEALDKLVSGVNLIAKAVKVTLGPRGKNVVFNNTYGAVVVTKDGVTVAREINSEDPVQNLGIQIAKQAAAKTAKIAGDGTTTATIITDALVTESLKLIKSGVSPIIIKRTLEELLGQVLTQVSEASKEVDTDNIYDIASISANNDFEIGKLIDSAFKYVGKEGVITVEDSKSDVTYVSTVDGYNFDRGYISPYFVNSKKATVEYEDPYILVTDKKLRYAQEVVPIMDKCLKAKKPLVIIADEVEGQVLGLLVTNRVRINLPAVAIKAPAYGERRGEMLQDIAIATGATVITENAGMKLEDITLEHLGRCKKIIVSKDETILVQPQGSESLVKERMDYLRSAIAESTESYVKEKLMERLAKLSGKVAVLFVGAPTDSELGEIKDRIDDALRATRSAVEKGFVVGGGTLLAKLAQKLDKKHLISQVFARALEAPLKTIATNCGESADVILNEVLKSEDLNYGYNARDNVFEDLVKAGVIDPTLVIEQALKNAVSAASMIILSDCVIYSKDPAMNNVTEIAEYDD